MLYGLRKLLGLVLLVTTAALAFSAPTLVASQPLEAVSEQSIIRDVSDTAKSKLGKNTLRLVGDWTGLVSQPNSSAETAYTIDIEFFISRDGMRFLSWYPELQCGGAGKLTRELANGASFFEEITKGHARCIDGDFLVTWQQDNKLFWDWGGNQATATLSRK